MDLLTISEAAGRLRTPVSTLRHWRLVGKGPRSFTIGRRVFYTADDIAEYIAAQHAAALVGSAA